MGGSILSWLWNRDVWIGVVSTILLGILVGCSTTDPGIQPIREPGARVEYEGFSFVQPGAGWSESVRERFGGLHLYTKLTGNKLHAIFEGVTFVLFPQLPGAIGEGVSAFETSEQRRMYFDSYVRRVEPALNSGRFTRLKFEHEIITIHGADCLKSEETLEDRGAPNAQGQVITMVSHHLDCFHPSVPDWFINLAYSQRTPPGVQPLDITKEGEAFLAGLQFSSTTVRIVPVRLEGQPFGMAAGHQSLWVTDYVKNSVARIDPDTLLVKATIPVGGHPGMLSAAGDAVWVSTAQPAQIQRIDPATNTVTDSIALPDKPGPVAATAGAVWVGVPSKGEVLQIDPVARTVRATIDAGLRLSDLEATDSGVWVTRLGPAYTLEYDANTHEKIQRYPDLLSPPSSMAWIGSIQVAFGSPWIADWVDGTIKRIDTENHRYAAEIKLNGGAVTWFRAVQGSVGFIPGSFLIFPENVPNPSEAYRSDILMTAFKDQLWVALLRQRCLVRIDPALNRVVGKPIALAGIPLQLKATDHALWVSYASAEYMTRIEP